MNAREDVKNRKSITLYPKKEKWQAVKSWLYKRVENITTDGADMMCDITLSHGDVNFPEPD